MSSLPPSPRYFRTAPLRISQATGSLRLPTRAPACFASQEDWNRFRQIAPASAGDGWTYCTDCCAARRDEMCIQNRCKYPGTTFVRIHGATVGRRKKRVVH